MVGWSGGRETGEDCDEDEEREGEMVSFGFEGGREGRRPS